MATNRHSLEVLTKTILTKLENGKMIIFNPSDRGAVSQELFTTISQHVMTEEDLSQKVRDEVAGASEAIAGQNITETDAFRSRKKALQQEIGENELNGFYFTTSVRDIGTRICKFLFDCDKIEDVFESDETIQKSVIETIQTFDESKIA